MTRQQPISTLSSSSAASDVYKRQDGTLPQINNILKDIIVKLEKLNTTVDNINKIGQEASEGVKDFPILRSDIDDTVKAVDAVVNKLDDLISSKKDPEFKAP